MDKLFINRIRFNERMEIPYGKFPCSLPSLRDFDIEIKSPVTFFVGENGIGKSTLIEGIAESYGFNPEGGSLNYNFRTIETHSGLSKFLTLSKFLRPRYGYFLRAESMYNTISYEGYLEAVEHFSDYGDNFEMVDEMTFFAMEKYGDLYSKYAERHHMSHGESFINLLSGMGQNSLYIFDEPECALSPTHQMSSLLLIKDCVEKGCQFIISTHSPILTAYPDADILQMTENGIERVDYEDTFLFNNYKMFINNRKSVLHQLLKQK